MEEDDGPEKSLRQLSQHYGVTGYVILNKSGIPVKSSSGMDSSRAIQVAALISELIVTTREFINKKYIQNSSQELCTLRLRTKKSEIIIAPEENYTLVVMHDPNYSEPTAEKEENKTLVTTGGEGEDKAPA